MKRNMPLPLTAWLSLGLTAAPAAGQSFQGLGDLPGGRFGSAAYGVSSNGSAVAGRANSPDPSSFGTEAFRWTPTEGMVGLGDLAGGNHSIANAVSADGSVVVGLSASSGEAFRWTAEGGMVGLGGSYSWAKDVSDNGSVVVGHAHLGSG